MSRAFKLLNFFVYDEFPARRDISILSKSSSHVQTKSASNDCMHVNEIFFFQSILEKLNKPHFFSHSIRKIIFFFTEDHDRTKRHVMYYAAPPTAMGPAGRRGKSTHRARGLYSITLYV